ncbi:MAG: FHA domain-containing protein [Bacteroidales bacterium]|nr:FHA domain-containing protein [Bacteroidales bacterium]
MSIIRIKCPLCGTIMRIMNNKIEKDKKLKCLGCKQILKFTEFQQIETKETPKKSKDNEKTRTSSCSGFASQNESTSEKTVIVSDKGQDSNINYPKEKATIGYLIELQTSKRYLLQEGKNTLGRKSTSSTVSVPIETNDRYMSRNHLTIEVVNGGKEYIHIAYNSKEEVETYVNNKMLSASDQIVLERGDSIQMGDTKFKFEL